MTLNPLDAAITVGHLPIYLVHQDWWWVAAMSVPLIVTAVFIKFNWQDGFEKVPSTPIAKSEEIQSTTP